jgi:ATP-dependent RNA helicase SUPV3L1/SUV3
MINLLGCSKDNFKRLIQKMNYKAYDKNNEIYFQYSPKKEKIKKIFKKINTDDNPFKILKNINFN